MLVEQQIFAVQHRAGGHPFLLQLRHQPVVVVLPGFQRQHPVQLGAAPDAVEGISVAVIGAPVRAFHHPAQPLPRRVAVHRNGDPAVVPGAGIAPVGRHRRVAVANAFHHPPVHRPVQQRFGDGGAASLGLRHINKLPAPGVEPMHQRQHHGGHRMLPGGVVRIGDFGHHRPAVRVAGDGGQPGRALGGRPGGAEVGPRTRKAVPGGRHHNYVRADPAQLFVLQPEVADDPGRKVLRENVGHGNQLPQDGAPLIPAQIQRQPQLVAVLLVKIGAPVPEIARHLVVIQRIGAVAFQPLHRLQPDNLRPHISQPLHRRGNGDELPHFHNANALQRPAHIG